jgi:hypothetical protein
VSFKVKARLRVLTGLFIESTLSSTVNFFFELSPKRSPMSFRSLARLIGVVFATISAAACSGQSPVTPDAAPSASTANAGSGALDAAPGAAAGTYDLLFVQNGLEVPTLPAGRGSELTLKAHVTTAATGALATSGTVTFEYCGYRGRANDITNPDEAPLSECLSGAASWKRLGSARVAMGDAFYVFGIVQYPRTVGFRFRYNGGRSGVADGGIVGEDFTWSEPTP